MYLIKSYEDNNKVEKVNGHRGCAYKRPVYVSIVTFLLCVVPRIGYRSRGVAMFCGSTDLIDYNIALCIVSSQSDSGSGYKSSLVAVYQLNDHNLCEDLP